ncbi:MAG: shikimate kinase [Chthoniobacterales bacterium]
MSLATSPYHNHNHPAAWNSCAATAYYLVRAVHRSIVLIGFMGSGKSSVGRRLALALGCPRFDTDRMITDALGMPIARIFEELGEERFREEESAVLEKIETEERAVIVTGGGVVLRPQNVARLRALGTVVCLTADLPTLLRRLAGHADRPLLENGDRAETVERLLRERAPFYLAAADLTLDTSALNHDEVTQSIQEFLVHAA